MYTYLGRATIVLEKEIVTGEIPMELAEEKNLIWRETSTSSSILYPLEAFPSSILLSVPFSI